MISAICHRQFSCKSPKTAHSSPRPSPNFDLQDIQRNREELMAELENDPEGYCDFETGRLIPTHLTSHDRLNTAL